MRKTRVELWTAEWEVMFEREKEALQCIFPSAEIHHIGSTSVKHIGYAKPIIDILLVVDDMQKAEVSCEGMKGLGYMSRGENGIAGRRYFIKGGDERTHHVHLYEDGNQQIKKHLLFKQYLQEHTDDARQYGELKFELQRRFPHNTHDYQNGKEAFVNNVMQKAEQWDEEKG
ncbi:GrpB family protein [Priestia taiwanensis]|uniref:Dephospho-CoA kinase/protein folding accessory domain-containing protein n=1 Tax=Priestia taiwanensis TaxID=1347902 RepID=A0A917AKZ2_9BACI|nr:GrpB family protein [Priestia taiwanensis]MBM7362062.1 GrpB-like predicted nucleotidyltransferase (UPF0157 family) [Priestia taiwanensis]GGE59131.1 hypothetical protein GCM10007140_06850 [Priestia taiwanensis]